MRNMSSTKSIMLAASMAFCLLVIPALSAPSNQSMILLVQHSGSGFAVNGSQYHDLQIGILGIAEFDSTKISNLISDNKTLGQIKSDLKNQVINETDAAVYSGRLLLADSIFKLSNITSKTVSDYNYSIDADLIGPITPADMDNNTTAGHISFEAAVHENSLVGHGNLVMNSGNYSGNYEALILMDSK
jgi:hypothetical protein